MVQTPFSIPDLSDPQLVGGGMDAVEWLVGFIAVIASSLIFWCVCTRSCKPAWDRAQRFPVDTGTWWRLALGRRQRLSASVIAATRTRISPSETTAARDPRNSPARYRPTTTVVEMDDASSDGGSFTRGGASSDGGSFTRGGASSDGGSFTRRQLLPRPEVSVASETLGRMEMFKGLSKPQQTVLVDSLTEERYAKDEHIIEQDEKGDAFFIIVSGSVRLTRRDPAATDAFILIKDKLLPGAYFGEMALLQPEGRRMATVTANEATVVMSLDREKFQELFGSTSDILQHEAERSVIGRL